MRGDLDALSAILDPDVKWHAGDPDAAYACQNRQQAVAFMRQNWGRRGAPPGELVELVDAGDKVVVIMRRFGEDAEPELVANLTTFRDGKVVEMVHYPNPDDARAAASAQ
jgi:ketosteroid isomerase-like protein